MYARPNVDATFTDVLVIVGGLVLVGWAASFLLGAVRAA
jgi:hypothetical protein